MLDRFATLRQLTAAAGMALCALTEPALAQTAGSQSVVAPSVAAPSATTISDDTRIAAVTPPGSEPTGRDAGSLSPTLPAPSRLGAGAGHWLIVVIQATLVEKGCAEAVSGEWDLPSRQAALNALGTGATMDVALVDPSEELLKALRAVPGRACAPTPKAKDSIAARATPDFEDTDNSKVQGATPRIKPKPRVERDSEPAKRPVARTQSTQRETSSGSRSSATSSGGKQASGPAVFVRPVGPGSF